MPCVINPDIYKEVETFSQLFATATPFPHVVIDNFLDESLANALINDFPKNSSMHRSHHYLFTNKHELPFWSSISESFHLLHQELLSNQFRSFVSSVSGEDLFMDSQFYGDLHQGTDQGFLNMHTDFSLHPLRDNWVHRLNVMIYLNKNWQQEYGGYLRLRAGLNGESQDISPAFNRCIFMLSNDTTYHGYSRLNLPENVTRKCIVVNFYKEEPVDKVPPRRLTKWDSQEQGFIFKEQFTELYNSLTSLKNRLLRVK
ncbi:2OG-Fe(II) oxygenase [Aetokthonos hydrillicola Thurmond2011]|jgi:Rps23 Pro-64 3,4-dihydroxylase Tpa1-like proline 4-hydroxylase|uniref:2OG-Fe(II) oxygenase n=1 Tax=Aetokthonos hydrillicola Thurmond2011 TaxID=2712845 RepID=A0AAP5I848_9CYAN|nr:2OG-Fe(II) oxygenase [Aetokthonos hydrillicola]MBO3458555.1 2OG-Fe(II) oxygenase [Aetokthonos hydrillicola CCALA 1050]MBW4584998.1 2OG-Fe(II) oxygenase [Aetokthonos hydrillicola CCALA 1050]MDR9894240.1 2OG-Fe(II) oxygenase [Aetokthonos hydrillicola Thurmond2011]